MKNDVLYTFAYVSLEYLNYLLAYLVVFRAGLKDRKSVCLLGYLFMLGIEMLILVLQGADDMEMNSILFGLVIPLWVLKKREKKWFLLYPVVAMGTSVITVSNTFLAGIVLDMPQYELLDNRVVGLECEAFTIFIILLVYVYQKLKKTEKSQIEITKHQYIIFYIGLICAFIVLGSMQTLSSDWEMTVKMKNVYGLASAFICVIFVIMSLWQGIIVSREMKYKQQTELYEEYMRMQEERIKTIIADDQKMRRYRHDMRAHLQVIKSFCENHDFKKLEEYYNEVVEHSAIFATERYTGNTAVDAVIRQLLEEAEAKQIQVLFDGMLSEDYIVSEFDFCTIMSNLIKNAIEACEKIGDGKAKEIKIHIVPQDKHLYILIKNTVEQNIEIKNQQLISTKSDKKNHGLGSKNVKSAVEKYQGSLEYQCENGWFQAEILI